jgi:hypothetical protein
MKKRIVFGLVFLLAVSFSVILVCSEELSIDIGDSYVPGESVKTRITLYDDDTNKIQGVIDYKILNYYTDIMASGSVNSGEEVLYELPTNAIQGPWKIIASYNGVETSNLFNVDDLEKAEIKLEGDILIIKNIGNNVYDKKILIYIGQEDQTAQIFLEIGQTKEIRLTAPDGKYNIRVIEGVDEEKENIFEFNDVSLTGNVVGLERVLGDAGFWQKNSIVILFLATLLLVILIITGLKTHKKYSK